MNSKRFLLIIFSIALLQPAHSQSEPWKGKKCAVVLTYDDALDEHLDHVMPALDSLNLKGTFYLIGASPIVSERMSEWRSAAEQGHELGNHTLMHPCNGDLPGRSWVSPDNDLSKYTLSRAVNEIRVTNTLLHAIDGKTERTFAYPCGETKIDTVLFYTGLENDFVGARGVEPGLQQAHEVDLNTINCFDINGQSGDYMIDLVLQAMESRTLLVFLFHGVGGGHTMNVSLEAHRELIQFIKQHEQDIWNATMVDVAGYVLGNQKGKK